jgi:basic amino acid/polyamine antiporter, APA family
VNNDQVLERSIGLFGAIGIGVGGIVGGGILALAGVAFANTGPSAVIAFALNGLIALITALTFAELSTAFPENGGTYTFSKKVLSVKTAFLVGWVVWFASIIAAVLYAIGFAAFGIILIESLSNLFLGHSFSWIRSGFILSTIAVISTLVYTYILVKQTGEGGKWGNILKILVFGLLILGGFKAYLGKSEIEVAQNLSPFFVAGTLGLFQAMGYTFIALQGFDLIAPLAGEIKQPNRTIPKSMLISLIIALVIYLPLLFFVTVAGMPQGESLIDISKNYPEAVIVIAAKSFMGNFGEWLVIVAGIISMLTALYANIYAASRISKRMARDRTLPHPLSLVNKRFKTPVNSIIITSILVVIIILIVPNVAVAGAAASLIFLIKFTLAHAISILVRYRSKLRDNCFKVPFFPYLQLLGLVSCLSLAIFQGIADPKAGIIVAGSMIIGVMLYILLFSRRAKIVDALLEGYDPELVRLRGKNPLVIVPIANPARAVSLLTLANTLVPEKIGKVLILCVVSAPYDSKEKQLYQKKLADSQAVLREALTESFESGFYPEALITVASNHWPEIARVSSFYQSDLLIIGFTNISEFENIHLIENLISSVKCDVVILRSPDKWKLSTCNKIWVPIGGLGIHDELRARLLGSLCRERSREITFIRAISTDSTEKQFNQTFKRLSELVKDEVPVDANVQVIRSDNFLQDLVKISDNIDLIILGIQSSNRRERIIGDFIVELSKRTNCPLILISR